MSGHGPRIDHIILAANDIHAAAAHISETYGLAGYVGGRHQGGWGTENYIIPLGEGYIEIAAVFDPKAARSCDWGRLIEASAKTTSAAHPWTLVTFCVEVPEGAAAVAERLGHEHARMLRRRPSGGELTWSVAAMSRFDEAGRAPKPFFITWDDPSMRPDKTSSAHTTVPLGIECVTLAGDKAAVREWIGADVPIEWTSGQPGLKAVGIRVEGGTIELR